jgi:hypothetical protein
MSSFPGRVPLIFPFSIESLLISLFLLQYQPLKLMLFGRASCFFSQSIRHFVSRITAVAWNPLEPNGHFPRLQLPSCVSDHFYNLLT